MSKKVTYCKTLAESKEKYTKYINNHIKAAQNAYDMAIDAFKDIFPDVYENDDDNSKVRQLYINLAHHDDSKFDRNEFFYYAMKFFPVDGIDPESKRVNDGFQIAWLHHVHNNAHHPAHWALVDDDSIMVFDMPDIYIIEMLCDWMAMSKYYNSTTLEYWESDSAKKLPMSTYTKSKVNEFMEWMVENNKQTLW